MRKVFIAIAACVLGAPLAVYLASQHQMRQQVAMMKREITENLYDPEAARFRSVELRSSSGPFVAITRPSDYALCGEINVKNALGAYIGYKSFLVTSGPRRILEVDTEPDFGVAQKVCDQAKASNPKDVIYAEP